MRSFQHACRDHAALDNAAHVDATLAADLWSAVKGEDVRAGGFSEAASDLVPAEHLALLAASDVAATYAFSLLWPLCQQRAGATPFEQREAARGAWQAFRERAAAVKPLAEGFGWDESAAWEHQRDCAGYGEVSTAEVERIARLAGRMFAALRVQKASRVSHAPEEVHSVELGGHVGRLLPAELVHLGEPTEVLLLARIVDRRALQYAVRGRSDASRGPLVIALDESGSMHDEGANMRNVWAKAAAIALARIALDDGRPVTIVHYAVSCVVRRLAPGKPLQLAEVARHFLSGGTQIARALERAAEAVCELAAKGDKGADVVLVSDGVDSSLDKVVEGDTTAGELAMEHLEATGARLWSIAIDCEFEGMLKDRAVRYAHIGSAQMAAGSIEPLAGAVV